VQTYKEKFSFDVKGITAHGFRSFVDNPEHFAFIALGHGARSDTYTKIIRALNHTKINVVTLELPRPENIRRYANCKTIDPGY